jgi:hypothetical protein
MKFESLEAAAGAVISEAPYVELITAPQCYDGEWRALANVNGALCVVALKVTPEETTEPHR